MKHSRRIHHESEINSTQPRFEIKPESFDSHGIWSGVIRLIVPIRESRSTHTSRYLEVGVAATDIIRPVDRHHKLTADPREGNALPDHKNAGIIADNTVFCGGCGWPSRGDLHHMQIKLFYGGYATIRLMHLIQERETRERNRMNCKLQNVESFVPL